MLPNPWVLVGILLIFAAVLVLLTTAAAWLSAREAPKGMKPLETGIEIIHGLPGSGKSFYITWKLSQIVTKQRRPVYTNMPIKTKVFRKYLQIRLGKPEAANYLQPLTRDIFERFTLRFAAYMDWYYAGNDIADFEREFGPNIEFGPELNWIPFGAILVIDEAHDWFPAKRELPIPEVTYSTKHRHLQHWVWLASQSPMYISLSWRRCCHVYRKCTDRGRLNLIFDLKLPFHVFAVEEWPGAVAENGVPAGEKSTACETFCPAFGLNYVFRLYSSHLHIKSFRSFIRQMETMRHQIEHPRTRTPLP